MADPVIQIKSRDYLKRVVGGRDRNYPWLEMHTWDMVRHYDDFLGDMMMGDATAPGTYETVTGVDGAFAILADKESGVAELSASTGAGASGEYCGVCLPELAWLGDLNACMAVRLQVDTITSVKVEVGFTDAVDDAGAVNSLAGNTFTASNAALWVMDTSDTLNWQCVGRSSTGPTGSAAASADKIEPGVAPVGATYETMVVCLRGNNAKFYRLNANGRVVYSSIWMPYAIEGGTPIVPWVFVQLRGTVDRNVNIDFVDFWQRRTAA